jgi:regulation of enolase protein 1 (concanavalin A-like superfamily)
MRRVQLPLGLFGLLPVLLLTLSLITLAAAAADPPTPEDAKAIEGWGTWVDPDGDCDVRAEDDAVIITVSPAVHDLWPENPEPKQRANAPRLLRDVKGDFTAEVKVAGTVLGGEFFRSGAMLIWQDERNFVRFERAGSFRDKKPRHYCWLHVFKDGKRVVNLQKEPVKDAETILRLERKGDRLVASFSQDDGKTFTKYPAQDLALDADVKVGVAALNASKAELTVRFEHLQLAAGPEAK